MSCWYMKRRLEAEKAMAESGNVKVVTPVVADTEEKPIVEEKTKKRSKKKEV